MVEVEEIELDLGLSIGGTFRKPAEKPTPELRPDGLVSEPDLRDGDMQVQRGDPKREIQALRRMEARKKREQKRGASRDRAVESEPECQRVFKREKTDSVDGVSGATNVTWTAPFRVQQVPPHQYATVQFVPLNNGLALPCWVAASEKNVGGIIDGVNGGEGKAKSNGSSRCSSAVSDYQSSSREDGGSADSHSHSANSFAEPTQLSSSNKEINVRTQPAEESASSSHPMISKQGNNNVQDRNHNVKEVITQAQPSNIMQPNPTNGKALHPVPIDKPLHNENSISSSGPLKEESTKVEMVIKPPPKPLTQTSSLPQMPYVSTKGDGPNGKIVNGFLYRYTKSEVSIVCVCHGSTFSPAEFVQHAGGTDTSHPLKHITVIPSAFG